MPAFILRNLIKIKEGRYIKERKKVLNRKFLYSFFSVVTVLATSGVLLVFLGSYALGQIHQKQPQSLNRFNK